MNKYIKSDIESFCNLFSLSEDLANSTFLITGASGLIGSMLIHCLLALQNGIRIIAPVRNLSKTQSLYDADELQSLQIYECDLMKEDYSGIDSVDYVIHCAAPTSSKFFVEKPVETATIIFEGTKSLLEYARKNNLKSFVFLSSLEVYGECLDDSKAVTENFQGYLDPMSVRSSYPMAKRAAENLCALYCREYDVPVTVARLTQTTGAGIAYDDNRIIAQFARLAANNEDIILHTSGEAARPYCYTVDCVAAILYILLKGQRGEAYNVSNDETYISARGMAEFLRDNINPSINVRVEIKENMGYAPVTKLRLTSQKLMELGWKPNYGLKEIFSRLITSLQNGN